MIIIEVEKKREKLKKHFLESLKYKDYKNSIILLYKFQEFSFDNGYTQHYFFTVNDVVLEYCVRDELINLIQLLITDFNVNPSICYNGAIRTAYGNNSLDIIELLWKDKRVKKTLKNDDENLYEILIKQDIKNKISSF